MFEHEQHKTNNLMQLEKLLCPEIKIMYANLIIIHPISQICQYIPSKQLQQCKSSQNIFEHKQWSPFSHSTINQLAWYKHQWPQQWTLYQKCNMDWRKRKVQKLTCFEGTRATVMFEGFEHKQVYSWPLQWWRMRYISSATLEDFQNPTCHERSLKEKNHDPHFQLENNGGSQP